MSASHVRNLKFCFQNKAQLKQRHPIRAPSSLPPRGHYALLAARPERIFITHTSNNRELVEEVKSYLEGLGYFEKIYETRAGGVISSHCGPGTLGVLFIEG